MMLPKSSFKEATIYTLHTLRVKTFLETIFELNMKKGIFYVDKFSVVDN